MQGEHQNHASIYCPQTFRIDKIRFEIHGGQTGQNSANHIQNSLYSDLYQTFPARGEVFTHENVEKSVHIMDDI